MTGYMRLWNPEWFSSAISADEVRKRDKDGNYPLMFEIRYSGTCSAAAAQIGAAADNALDGTTTPVKVYVDCAADTDKDASTGHVRKVRIIGISVASDQAYINGTEDPVYSIEEVNLTAAGGTTAVATSRYYLRVIHFYASDWGSGGSDASNAIYVQDDAAGTTKYLTIAQNYNESNNGGLIYVADGYYGRTVKLRAGLNDAAFNNA